MKTPLFDTHKVPQDAAAVIQEFDKIIQGVSPLNSRQLQQLPQNIRNLSQQMTSDRASRRLGYMNENIQLSSYVRYFSWWNLVRLTRLFSNLPEQCFPDNDAVCLDLGSGPLTVVIALYLARPELRKKKLTWYCLDVSANSMALGEDIFLSVCARLGEEPWQIIRVKGSFGSFIKQKAQFITCANMFNELDQATDMPPEFKVKKYFEQLCNYAGENPLFLLIEPGVPKAARTLALLRDRFIKAGLKITAPCPHAEKCPMDGFRAYTGSKCKWCNFAFETGDAPQGLLKLSERAKLPKERATLSFVAVDSRVKPENDKGKPENDKGKAENDKGKPEYASADLSIRITSDKIRLPNYMAGFYGCSRLGLVLVTIPDSNNTKLPKPPFVPKSGDLIQVKIKTPDSLPKDEKSGALIIKL
ncbi:MAG: hypothetical protein IK102_09245 [Treponema sp.]|nr:hypothetical protein [Treponema sp.]